jgi:hypothetical protein
VKTWQNVLFAAILGLWSLHLLWLAWHFAPEAGDAGKRLLTGTWGQAVRQENPFYRWIFRLKEVIPPRGAYVFMDRYEAGKEIEARYHLYPRRHVLLSPHASPSFLYYALRHKQAAYLVVMDGGQPLMDLKAALASPAFQAVDLPGPGLVFTVEPTLISGDFYD